ncbi:hypothetical protein EJ06DRAFT_529011 [Trichodelitschia bisporula]|uniref:Uncharacterized protein n=1 Tax=Trichodelitschia bisporula TaxID=703511 RepID=A0A6G1I159_9PEZI|nr:hypothetical protein EJ06DRAFT_529011 [Trichodelitschia bisporula]
MPSLSSPGTKNATGILPSTSPISSLPSSLGSFTTPPNRLPNSPTPASDAGVSSASDTSPSSARTGFLWYLLVFNQDSHYRQAGNGGRSL